jgi:hypothetical protein
VRLVTQHPLPAAICAVAFALTAGVFVFARPQYRPPHHGPTIRLPDNAPAQDAAGRQGWIWPDGVPGWEPGHKIKDVPVSGMQSIEADPARLAAAHMGLEAEQVRVLVATRQLPGHGPLAIYAAPLAGTTFEGKPVVCLGVDLPRASATQWLCPGASHPGPDVARSRVLVAVSTVEWSSPSAGRQISIQLAGVSRGDVYRVVLHIPGQTKLSDWVLYERGKTWGWGQFEAAVGVPPSAGVPELRIYGRKGLVQTLRLDLSPGDERVIQ